MYLTDHRLGLRGALVLLSITAAMPLLAGCGGYVLHGRVIEGDAPGISIVDRDDPRLSGPGAAAGVADARIDVIRDPLRPNRSHVGGDVSGPDGAFAIDLPAFGAGWMDEQWLIETSRRDYRNAESLLRLPADTSRRRLLIVLERGTAAPRERVEDLMREFDHYR